MDEIKTTITVTFEDGNSASWVYKKDYDTFKIDSGVLILLLGSRVLAIYAAGFWRSIIPHYE